jgi:hypothetical protein
LKYQPGAYYGEDVEAHIDEDIRESVLPQIRDKMRYTDIGGDKYFLIANNRTMDAFNTQRVKPTWELWYVNGHGSSVQVTDREGNIVMYRFGELSRPGKNGNHALENDAAQ